MTTHGFELLREQALPELNSVARLYRHEGTGAELLSVLNDDENKVFSITFRTPPSDSTGLPHILEHSVLCGSRKFPLKEPFIELVKGSLNTFLNAMTYPDKTMYPVASTNLQDFYNLVDVYLDAVLFPNITPQTLQQEGWHYELESADAPLTYKGVVFNEMKGANSSPERLLYMYQQQALLPDTPYGVDSGGIAAEIPNLTYQQFKGFHESYYHPSNARIFFYGDDPEGERLRRLDAVLSEFERQAVTSELPVQSPFDAPRRVTHRYPAGEGEVDGRRALVTVNWLLGEVWDPEQALALHILNHILLGAPGSPLRKALIESGLGEDLAGYGLETDIRQAMFATGLKGTAEEEADRIEALILDTLRGLAEGGMDAESVEAGVNATEFSLRENNSGSYPRGLVVLSRALAFWLHDQDPLAPLSFEQPLARIKARLAAGEPLFEGLIRACFLDNPHRTTVILQPDPMLASELEQAERARLDAARAAMSDEEVEQVIAEAQALREAQERPDAPEVLATLPRLSLGDLERENKPIPLGEETVADTRVLIHDLPTAGILYFDLGLDLHTLPADLLPYAPLFGRALLEMGTAREDFVRLSQRIDRKTGGIHPHLLAGARRGSEEGVAWLFLRGKVMAAQADELFSILQDVLLTTQLDDPARFGQMVLEEKAGIEASLVPAGHRFVNRRLKAHFHEGEWAHEQVAGLAQLEFLRRLAGEMQSDWPKVLTGLETLRERLITRPALLGNLTVAGEQWASVRTALGDFLGSLPAALAPRAGWEWGAAPEAEGLAIPAPVHYVGKAAPLYEAGYRLHGSALVITRYLYTSWLWDQVRVQGGAYGGFSTFDATSGIFSFLSYRDPNLLNTLSVYDRTGDFLRGLDLSQEAVTSSIIGAISDFDTYQLPDAKGLTSVSRWLMGMTDAVRQQLREEILGTTAADFRAFADVVDGVRDRGLITVMGPSESLEAASAQLDTRLKIVKVL